MKKFLFMLFIASFMLTSCNKSAKLNSEVDKIESTHDHAGSRATMAESTALAEQGRAKVQEGSDQITKALAERKTIAEIEAEAAERRAMYENLAN